MELLRHGASRRDWDFVIEEEWIDHLKSYKKFDFLG